MARYAAFLRAINVGGRRIKAPELCAPFVSLDFSEVNTFRASGNVVFDAPRKPSEGSIEKQLEKELGYEVGVFLRGPAQMAELAGGEPFEPGAKYHVWFVKKLPSPARQRDILKLSTEDDKLAFGKRELFWRPRGKMMDSGLDLDAVGKLLGLNTVRTNGTVEQIQSKYFAG